MSDDQETKPTEETPKVEEEEPKKEEDDKVKEEESTATFEPVVSKFLLKGGARKKWNCEKNVDDDWIEMVICCPWGEDWRPVGLVGYIEEGWRR